MVVPHAYPYLFIKGTNIMDRYIDSHDFNKLRPIAFLPALRQQLNREQRRELDYILHSYPYKYRIKQSRYDNVKKFFRILSIRRY
jgi:hypothetical protein